MPPIRTDATTQPAIRLLTRRFCNSLYDVEIRRVICSTNSWVILSSLAENRCDLGVCFVEDVYDAAA
jgi:hypothetical protein